MSSQFSTPAAHLALLKSEVISPMLNVPRKRKQLITEKTRKLASQFVKACRRVLPHLLGKLVRWILFQWLLDYLELDWAEEPRE